MSESGHVSNCTNSMHTCLGIDSDSWVRVLDPKKRKQIQDRLAQRARRKRIAELNRAVKAQEAQDSIPTPPLSAGTDPTDDQSSVATDEALVSGPNFVLAGTTALPDFNQPASSRSVAYVEQTIGSDHRLLTKHVTSVFAALFNNGLILGIRCGIQVPILSPPCTSKVPLSLHPSRTQMTVLHIPWIDRFPFPKMRDNAITMSGAFDEEEFLGDLFTGDSFTIRPRSVSWDPKAWVMVRGFEEKWGYLFC